MPINFRFLTQKFQIYSPKIWDLLAINIRLSVICLCRRFIAAARKYIERSSIDIHIVIHHQDLSLCSSYCTNIFPLYKYFFPASITELCMFQLFANTMQYKFIEEKHKYYNSRSSYKILSHLSSIPYNKQTNKQFLLRTEHEYYIVLE